MGSKLLKVLREGQLKEVKEILQGNPSIINALIQGFSLLHWTCLYSQADILALLLALPDVDVNLKDHSGRSPFSLACSLGVECVVFLLLRDTRVAVNGADTDGATPLYWLAKLNYLQVLKEWIASGRELDLQVQQDGTSNIVEIARIAKNKEVAALLGNFHTHPEKTRHQVRTELGYYDDQAAQLYALVAFLSKDLLECRSKEGKVKKAAKRTRFFRMTRQLPAEIQVMLCHRVAGCMRSVISARKKQAALETLKMTLLAE